MNRDRDPSPAAGAGPAAPRGSAAAWRSGWRRHWRRAAAIAGILLLILLAVRQPLAELLWPQTRAQELREEAGAALERGHLSAADGSGARELYEAALAMEPDRSEARQGLMRVALAALERARRATAQNHFADAHAALRLARELDAPRDASAAAADALRRREAAHAGLDQLWARAQQAHRAGRLHGDPAAALPLYRRILELDSGNAEVLRAREDAIGELLQEARAGLRRGELAGAAAAVALARSFDPGHVDLPDTAARLAEEREAALAAAARELEGGRLERAERHYRRLLEMDREAADARAGLDRVAVALAQRAARLSADFRFADADAVLERAGALAPEHPAVLEAARHVERARRLKARLGPRLSPRERAARVRDLLTAAAAAEARGDLLTPPGESAYDHLRGARAIAPEDPDVRRASEKLLPVARGCFERELRSNSLGRARACLDARVALADEVEDLALARRRLAQRWLAVGEERLGAGELQPARHAAATAREIDPAVPGLAEFEARLERASARVD
ncbi:hypothetical protein QFW77_04330 [Luteimonas sp. RD2P54]|uniref:Tetratricopeptide repeat protein n=1 Tax=Luteimonas endophytica TaxID=3042023 RepID=A0ABT6J5Y9_9GAMM|nr:hypothetical protein [Luteimonas endophytica]MDH5822216.1 hypothetical protein [Luteimonas endophytica]